MYSLLVWIARLLAGLIGLAVLVYIFAPRERVLRSGPFAGDLSDPDAYLAQREAAVEGITPGAEARIIWAGTRGEHTPLTVLYLHGFSATSEEIRPVPDNVAAALGANLVFARTRGHGRDGAALAEARAGDWLDDAAAFLAVARAVGDRVLIVSTSTGCTLAALALSEPDMGRDVVGAVFISPNFALADWRGRLLQLPFARRFVPWLNGPLREFDPINEGHGRYWTTTYPIGAAVTLGTLMREANARDLSQVTQPALMIYAETDQVISAAVARALPDRWGGEMTAVALTMPPEGVDPYHHVITGDILSPATTDAVSAQIIAWARRVLP